MSAIDYDLLSRSEIRQKYGLSLAHHLFMHVMFRFMPYREFGQDYKIRREFIDYYFDECVAKLILYNDEDRSMCLMCQSCLSGKKLLDVDSVCNIKRRMLLEPLPNNEYMSCDLCGHSDWWR